jgi:hypothetical protein
MHKIYRKLKYKLFKSITNQQAKENPIKTSLRDSKMVTRGRKQKACFLKQTLGEVLEIHHIPGRKNHQEEAKL